MNFRPLALLALLSALVSPYAAPQTATRTPATSTLSAVPPLVPFSGQMEGQIGEMSVTFLIYKEQQGGEPLFTESQMISFDHAGRYKVQLGAANPHGLPIDLFATGEARWLEIQVPGREPQPRILLASVPYALKAADAATLDGLPASAFALAGAHTPAANTASVAISPGAGANVTTTGGTANKLAKFSGSNTVVNSILYDNGTQIGIGTTAPTAALTVAGSTTVNGSSTLNGQVMLPATGTATASKGYNSQYIKLYTSAYNSFSKSVVPPRFQLQAEAMGNNTASPNATLNLLASSTSSAPTETGLSINTNGTINFAPGQSFPGGKVTSVGLSAPSSDFAVTGSPVTSAGTLGLNWKVAPTSADNANALVKRDASGSFAAGAITANLGVQSTNNGATGVLGEGNVGVWGQSNGSNGGSDGVHGVTGSGGASGVAGVNNAGGVGVYGTGGTGVFGTGSNYGFLTDTNVSQARTAGGWVKAMVAVGEAPNTIYACFNSTLTGAAAVTPPCGIDMQHTAAGSYRFNFNFEVDDRFYSTQILEDSALALALYRSGSGVTIYSYYAEGDLEDAGFQLIIY